MNKRNTTQPLVLDSSKLIFPPLRDELFSIFDSISKKLTQDGIPKEKWVVEFSALSRKFINFLGLCEHNKSLELASLEKFFAINFPEVAFTFLKKLISETNKEEKLSLYVFGLNFDAYIKATNPKILSLNCIRAKKNWQETLLLYQPYTSQFLPASPFCLSSETVPQINDMVQESQRRCSEGDFSFFAKMSANRMVVLSGTLKEMAEIIQAICDQPCAEDLITSSKLRLQQFSELNSEVCSVFEIFAAQKKKYGEKNFTQEELKVWCKEHNKENEYIYLSEKLTKWISKLKNLQSFCKHLNHQAQEAREYILGAVEAFEDIEDAVKPFLERINQQRLKELVSRNLCTYFLQKKLDVFTKALRYESEVCIRFILTTENYASSISGPERNVYGWDYTSSEEMVKLRVKIKTPSPSVSAVKLPIMFNPCLGNEELEMRYDLLLDPNYYRSLLDEELKRNKDTTWEFRPHHLQSFTNHHLSLKDTFLNTVYKSYTCPLPSSSGSLPLISSGISLKEKESLSWKEEKEIDCGFFEEILEALRDQESIILSKTRKRKMSETGPARPRWYEANDRFFGDDLRRARKALSVTSHLSPAGVY